MTTQAIPDIRVAALSDPGCDPSKAINEDAYLQVQSPRASLLVVCDGMGGHEGGRVASNTAVQVLRSLFETSTPEAGEVRFLRQSIETAGRAVHALANEREPELRPGSTCVALLFTTGTVAVAHVGDSRAYRWRSGALERLTNDHSVINDLVMAGVLTAEQAKNHPDAHRITRALGMNGQVVVDVRELTDGRAGDRYLLCSDGLTDLVNDDEIARLVGAAPAEDLSRACVALVELAKQRGGHDNVTAVVAHVVDPGMRTGNNLEGLAHADATNRMTVPGSHPIQPTIALEDATSDPRLAPTIVEAALHAPAATETLPVATVSSDNATAAMPAISAVPTPKWDTSHGSSAPSPQSSARYLLLAVMVSALVVIGLIIWAIIR